MSHMSTLDILKMNAVMSEIRNLTNLIRYYAEPGPSHNLRMSVHYLRQRRFVMAKHGLRLEGLFI